MLGTRIVKKEEIENCEGFVADYFLALDLAQALLNNTKTTDDREGVFQILDAFIFYTPITWECYQAGIFAYFVISTDVRANVINPESIAINIANEVFYIMSDIAAQVANDFYKDWYSFSYFLGDLVYRLIVVHHDFWGYTPI
jgi:hypothetical protein